MPKFNKQKFKDEFKKVVGSRFWRHIHKETLIPFRERKIPDRIKFLDELSERIIQRKYDPYPPRSYVVSHKQNLVVRFIPALSREDYCVYFFCIKKLEDEIAHNRVIGTYGGWRLGGKIRRLENFDEVSSVPDFSYDRFAWLKAWTEFQRKAYNLYRLNKKLKYFYIFDIANFYDSIRLDRLELITREVADKRKTFEVNLLFYFLCNWNRGYLNYERQSMGIPQDEVGDCSRILGNFYLQEYDNYLYKLTKKENSAYLRYADDVNGVNSIF